jgi:predicted PurR-regulated permease PerM
MQTELQQVLESIAELKTEFRASETRLETKIDTFNEKFDNYQKATQSLVNLAFGLIASATIVTVVSNVFHR